MSLKKPTKRNKLLLLAVILLILVITNIYFYNKEDKIYILKEYSVKGKLIGTNEYIIRNGDTIFQGKFINYNERGIKISEGQFINNEPYGICKYYYDNGKIESVYFRENSKINLESFAYYPDGKIKQYRMYSDFGAPLHTTNFDKDGVTGSYNGRPHFEIHLHKIANHQYKQIKNSFTLGETLKYSYIIANIPKTKRSIKIENISVDNSKVKRTLKHIEPCQWDVEEVLTKKGKNTIQSIVKYEFKDKVTPVFIDTLSFDIEVH
ncbi:toxin-antitoxin system YwqK family antitoxin [Flavobacterium davisii]|uniref:toxin-antitoxin system YwqK family antitoxin n=1 Tax=Flavobacterium davisii TaxID=2906077 RepID=UPI0035CEC2A3